MNLKRLVACAVLMAMILAVTSALSRAQDAASRADEVAAKAWSVLAQNCYQCHGQNPDPKLHKAKLNLKDHTSLTNAVRGIVVANKPDESELIKRVENSDEAERMPPKKPQLSVSDRKALRDWIAAGAPRFPAKPAEAASTKPAEKTPPTAESPAVAKTPRSDVEVISPLPVAQREAAGAEALARVKVILKTHCAGCHGGSEPAAGFDILKRDVLVAKKKLKPGDSDGSAIIDAIVDGRMPKGQKKMSEQDIQSLRNWVAQQAPELPEDKVVASDKVGQDFVLSAILQDIRQMPNDDRQFVRYFSINHLLGRGATQEELDKHYLAFVKAINHLTWMPSIVKPVRFEPTGTVYRVNIRDLGWDATPFQSLNANQQVTKKSERNLYDLILLEYPYGILDMDGEMAQSLLAEYLMPGGQQIQVRPVAYVRADWFASVATSSPLYEDLLQLPFSLEKLELRLQVDTKGNLERFNAARAGVTNSGVSRNNRVVERHLIPTGAYWKSYDFRTSRGGENMFRDPVNFTFSGGEMVFSLPNGLNGYYLCDTNGKRIDAAPTEIVTDDNASDKTVRNGLACMRCHDQGIKPFPGDDVRGRVQQIRFLEPGKQADVLRLYPGTEKILAHVQQDTKRFTTKMAEAFDKPAPDQAKGGKVAEPLKDVSQRFLDRPLNADEAVAELGLPKATEGVKAKFETQDQVGAGLYPLAHKGTVRRDSWDESFDKTVRNFRLGTPIVPIDGIGMKDFDPPETSNLGVELKTNGKVFKPGDQLKITVKNTSAKTLFIELIGTSDKGMRVILLQPQQLAPGATYEHPAVAVSAGTGKEQVTLYASDAQFDCAELLRIPPRERAAGQDVFDRVVHNFYKCEFDAQRRRFTMTVDPGLRMVKKTAQFETQ